ncbi:MAG: hypothetical protein J7621_27535 [Niastella sp.]|nr:hypothetical protein [Niastella sp.]
MENIIAQQPSLNGGTHFRQPAIVRFLAHLFSYVFHPVLIASYVTAFLVFLHPLAFAGYDFRDRFLVLAAVFFSSTFLPAFSVFLMERLGFVSSIFLRTQRERIIPYAAAIIFYFWIWYVFRNQHRTPIFFVQFLLGTFLGVCGAWMWNIRQKVSMHATAVGGMVMFFLLQILTGKEVTGQYFAVALLIAGIVCTSRLIVSDHSREEIYVGFFTGVAAQVVAWWI